MPLTDAQLAKLWSGAGGHLESDETIAATAKGISAPRGAAFLVGLLAFGGGLVIWLLFPRWQFIVTDRRILALRMHRILPGRFMGEVISYPYYELREVRFEGSSHGADMTLIGAATGSDKVRYGRLTGWKPAQKDFKSAIASGGVDSRPAA